MNAEYGMDARITKAKSPTRLLVRIHDNVNRALWIAGAVIVAFFFIVVSPKFSEAVVRAQQVRAAEIEAEHRSYCDKLGIGASTRANARCIALLQEFRNRVEQRFAAELSDL
jgi:beta-lactamase regulating signal transducer with metallopeptidase domain